MSLTRIPISTLVLIGSTTAFATGTLDFKAGEYCLSMSVSIESGKVLDPVSFSYPQSRIPVKINRTQFKVFRCESKRRRLNAVFVSPESKGIPSFHFEIHGSKGVLTVGNQRIHFIADWVAQ